MKLVLSRPGVGKVPLITVLVPAYNHAAYIAQCLASINSIRAAEMIEIVVIDDGSRDGTLKLITAFPFHPDIAVRIFAKTNAGLVDSLARGLAVARGHFLCVMASDDRFAEGALDAVLELQADPRRALTAVLCNATFFAGPVSGARSNGTSVYTNETVHMFAVDAAERYRLLCVRFPRPMLLQSSVLPVSTLREEGAWTDGFQLDDWPAFIKIARAETLGRVTFEFRPDIVLAEYRDHLAGMHNNLDRMTEICLEVSRRGVPPRWKSAAESFIHRQAALAHLASGRIQAGLAAWARSVAADPGVDSLLGLPARIGRAVFHRLASRCVRLGRL